MSDWLLRCWKALSRAAVWCIEVPHWRSPKSDTDVKGGVFWQTLPRTSLLLHVFITNWLCLDFSEWEKLWKKNIYDVHTQNTPPAPHPYQIKWCKSCKMVLQNVFIMWMKNVFCFKTSQCVCLFIIFSSASKLNAIVLFHASLFLNI